MKELRKHELVGKVVSAKNDKTITVLVENIHYMEKELNIQRNMLHMMKII